MEQTEIKPATGNDTAISELQAEVQALRSFVLGMLVVVIVLSGAVNLFFLRQASLVNGQLALQQQENKQNVEEFAARTGPAIATFWTKVNEFAKTNPDIGQLLSKYNFVGTPPPGPIPAGTPPVTAPAPGVPKK